MTFSAVTAIDAARAAYDAALDAAFADAARAAAAARAEIDRLTADRAP